MRVDEDEAKKKGTGKHVGIHRIRNPTITTSTVWQASAHLPRFGSLVVVGRTDDRQAEDLRERKMNTRWRNGKPLKRFCVADFWCSGTEEQLRDGKFIGVVSTFPKLDHLSDLNVFVCYFLRFFHAVNSLGS